MTEESDSYRLGIVRQEMEAINIKDNLIERFKICPPIVRAAIIALMDFQENLDYMGYDISYFQEDLPNVVKRAIKPWEIY